MKKKVRHHSEVKALQKTGRIWYAHSCPVLHLIMSEEDKRHSMNQLAEYNTRFGALVEEYELLLATVFLLICLSYSVIYSYKKHPSTHYCPWLPSRTIFIPFDYTTLPMHIIVECWKKSAFNSFSL